MEVSTRADGPQYRRMPKIKEKINQYLIDQLVDMGYNKDLIIVTSRELPREECGCVANVLVTASTEEILDEF